MRIAPVYGSSINFAGRKHNHKDDTKSEYLMRNKTAKIPAVVLLTVTLISILPKNPITHEPFESEFNITQEDKLSKLAKLHKKLEKCDYGHHGSKHKRKKTH